MAVCLAVGAFSGVHAQFKINMKFLGAVLKAAKAATLGNEEVV